MRRYVLLLALLLALPALVPPRALAQVQTFRKEVRQIMGSAQSPDDARAAAVAKAKRDALEEAGTWLESLSEVKGYALARDDVTALASGIVQTRIVEEQRFVEGDAFGVRVVAEVRVDNAGLADRIRATLADRQRMAEARANATRDKVLLARLAAVERQMAEMKNASEAEKAAVRTAVQSNARQLTAREWFEKGDALWNDKQGRYTVPSQAIEYFTKAIEADPDYTSAYFLRGSAHVDLEHYERAIEDFDRLILLTDDAKGYVARARAYRGLGKERLMYQDYRFACDRKDKWACVRVRNQELLVESVQKVCASGKGFWKDYCEWWKEEKAKLE